MFYSEDSYRSGAAYVFTKYPNNDVSWKRQKLTIPDVQLSVGDNFGMVVEIDKDTLIVSAPETDYGN